MPLFSTNQSEFECSYLKCPRNCLWELQNNVHPMYIGWCTFRRQGCLQHVKLISCGRGWWHGNSFSVNVFTDPVDVIDVDWSSLMPKQPKEPREAGAALLKFTPGAVMLRVGISKRLAGPELFTKIKETCQRVLEKPKGNYFCRV